MRETQTTYKPPENERFFITEEQLKELLYSGGWFQRGGSTQNKEYTKQYRGCFTAMNGMITFSDGKNTWFAAYDENKDDKLRQLGFKSISSMFCPPAEVLHNLQR